MSHPVIDLTEGEVSVLKFYSGDRVKVTDGSVKGMTGEVTQIWVVEHPTPIDENRYDVINGDGVTRTFKESELELCQDQPKVKSLFESVVLDREFPIGQDNENVYVEQAAIKGGFNNIRLAVRGSEGKYPHFHFYKGIAPSKGIKDGRRGGGCIMLTSAKYFIHGSHTETMNPKEIKALIEFLKSKHASGLNVTNWQYIVSLWNANNEYQPQVPVDAKIPEYFSTMPSITDHRGKK